jgi:beta-galactosidase
VASRNEARFQTDFLKAVARKAGIRPAMKTALPTGVTAQFRSDGNHDFVFLQNYSDVSKSFSLAPEKFDDLLTGKKVAPLLKLAPFGVRVLKRTSA